MKKTANSLRKKTVVSFLLPAVRTGLFALICLLPAPAFAQTADTKESEGQAYDTARSFSYYFEEGLRLKALEQYGAAFEMFRHCLSLDSTSAAAHAEIAAFYRAMNQTERYVAHYEKAFALDPGNDWYGLQLAGSSIKSPVGISLRSKGLMQTAASMLARRSMPAERLVAYWGSGCLDRLTIFTVISLWRLNLL
jgi:tetratricopeptide (TPR) repeat protein